MSVVFKEDFSDPIDHNVGGDDKQETPKLEIDVQEPVTKRRGRRPKAEIPKADKEPEPKAKTGAKKSTKETLQIDREMLAKQLAAGHAMLAAYLRKPYFTITDEEAARLADAFGDILEYYQVTVAKGVVLWLNLATALVMVEGPRVAMLLAQREVKPAPATGAATGSIDGIPIA
jgi:hypothetical protein